MGDEVLPWEAALSFLGRTSFRKLFADPPCSHSPALLGVRGFGFRRGTEAVHSLKLCTGLFIHPLLLQGWGNWSSCYYLSGSPAAPSHPVVSLPVFD